jgi:transcriptional regulator
MSSLDLSDKDKALVLAMRRQGKTVAEIADVLVDASLNTNNIQKNIKNVAAINRVSRYVETLPRRLAFLAGDAVFDKPAEYV